MQSQKEKYKFGPSTSSENEGLFYSYSNTHSSKATTTVKEKRKNEYLNANQANQAPGNLKGVQPWQLLLHLYRQTHFAIRA